MTYVNGEQPCNRRGFVYGLLLAARPRFAALRRPSAYEVTKSDADWKKLLSPAAYDVLRHAGHRSSPSPAR